MIQSMPIAQVRKDLSQLPDVFAAEPQPSALAVTRRGQPVLALMPWALYQGIAETLEVLGDEVFYQRWDNLLRCATHHALEQTPKQCGTQQR